MYSNSARNRTCFSSRLIEPARLRFEMPQHGVRREDDKITLLARTQAVIHIVEANGQIRFVQAVKLFEHVAPRHRARESNSTEILQKMRARRVPRMTCRKKLMRMHGNDVPVDDHAGMLDRIVRIKQFRTNHPNFRTLRVF